MISAHVLAQAREIRQRFQSATPFRHVAIDDFLEAAACEALLRDFPAFDPKRAVNELGEVGRKAVVERVDRISPFYRQFHAYISSPQFLRAMSALTGVSDLIADETLFGGGTHENMSGQALDVHVDFNIDERSMLHRRLNLLVYLNKQWDEAWGGAIELHSNPRRPEVDDVKRFLPLFNRALIFETNEHSWHGFRRIELPPGKAHLSRKSFSIYLYTRERPAEEVVAPHTTFYVPDPLPAHFKAGHTLDEHDERTLRTLMASRDGLLEMYQRLLVEKEQRFHDVLAVDARDRQECHAVIASRTWRLALALHRLRFRARRLLAG
jgi:hypothetical protein